jgi:hypothetical protein
VFHLSCAANIVKSPFLRIRSGTSRSLMVPPPSLGTPSLVILAHRNPRESKYKVLRTLYELHTEYSRTLYDIECLPGRRLNLVFVGLVPLASGCMKARIRTSLMYQTNASNCPSFGQLQHVLCAQHFSKRENRGLSLWYILAIFLRPVVYTRRVHMVS